MADGLDVPPTVLSTREHHCLGQKDRLLHRLTSSGDLRHPHANFTNYSWVMSEICRESQGSLTRSLSGDISLAMGLWEWGWSSTGRDGPFHLLPSFNTSLLSSIQSTNMYRGQQDGSLLHSIHQVSPGTTQPTSTSTSTGGDDQAQIAHATMNTWG